MPVSKQDNVKYSQNTKYAYKVAVIGANSTGKTSAILRITQNLFHQDYTRTLKSYSAKKTIKVHSRLLLKLQFIETIGKNYEFKSPTSILHDCHAILLFYDITKQESFNQLHIIFHQLKQYLTKEVVFGIVGTHLDKIYKREIDYSDCSKWMKRNDISLFYEISCKTNENMSELVHDLCKQLINKINPDCNEQNPQTSTNISEEESFLYNSSKFIILQKKLSLKQKECEQLWKEYEQVLNKLSFFQNKMKKEDSLLLCNMRSNDELQEKMQLLQGNILIIEDYYRRKQDTVQEQYLLKIKTQQHQCQKYQQENEELREEIQKMKVLLQQIESYILQLEQNRSNLQKIKGEQIKTLKDQITSLNNSIYELQQQLNLEKENNAHLKQQIIDIQQRFDVQKTRLGMIIEAKNNETKKLQKKYDQNEQQIDQYEDMMVQYRQQIIQRRQEKENLQAQLALQLQKFYKSKWHYENTINHLQDQFKQFVEKSKKERQQLITKHTDMVALAIKEKQYEINIIRKYINTIQNKQQIPGNHLKNISKQDKEDRQSFFMSFLDNFMIILKQKSQNTHKNLQNIFQSFQEIRQEFYSLKEVTARIDLSDILYDAKEGQNDNDQFEPESLSPQQYKIWQMMNAQTQKRVSICINIILKLTDRIQDINGYFKTNLDHINQNMGILQAINQVGMQKYFNSLQQS